MKRWLEGALVATALIGGSALAHEGGAHVRGVVKEISAERLVVDTPSGEAVTVALTPETRITRGTVTIHAADVHPGDRAVVHAKRGAGQLQATDVKLGTP
ncbi:DUF5666 domain-containing protein [Anaeromyxobacter oryzae]|uniref:DUF5666 domain-containing protein n=1 Tax=Anaeromyxobacter oryzae TaxID=2918170 RepID=A0ABM7WSF0_9BACT|nr:DUF5666 domain-containing protein [Anaeromyxobacter oryzae]BDG02405.1 hypothetical protein AMOR_14010 [Anaeromyxobacter oryzae]